MRVVMSTTQLEANLTEAADQLSGEFPEVVAVYLFGSQAEGRAHAASDLISARIRNL
jgi:predicted nucleotidyltransferase